jgi:hypothetical protein
MVLFTSTGQSIFMMRFVGIKNQDGQICFLLRIYIIIFGAISPSFGIFTNKNKIKRFSVICNTYIKSHIDCNRVYENPVPGKLKDRIKRFYYTIYIIIFSILYSKDDVIFIFSIYIFYRNK